MIDPRDITVVLQGDCSDGLAARIAQLRRVLPGAPVVLSTWQDATGAEGFGADQAVFSADPGALPPYKLGPCKPNNVNRQIVTSAAGLAVVRTPYALKLRCDAQLAHAGFLQALAGVARLEPQAAQRIVTLARFSIDPRLFEQMPLHLSDWFQFGPTPRLQALWDAPLMSAADATHYQRHAHAPHATWFDRRFVARWPAEQHVWRAYAARLGHAVPGFHNDTAPAVLASHDRFLAREVLLLEPAQAGVHLPELAWAERSGMQRFNCLSHLDWLGAAAHALGWRLSPEQSRAIQRRADAKRRVQQAFRCMRPIVPLLVRPPLKPAIGRLLRAADGASTPSRQPH